MLKQIFIKKPARTNVANRWKISESERAEGAQLSVAQHAKWACSRGKNGGTSKNLLCWCDEKFPAQTIKRECVRRKMYTRQRWKCVKMRSVWWKFIHCRMFSIWNGTEELYQLFCLSLSTGMDFSFWTFFLCGARFQEKYFQWNFCCGLCTINSSFT